jgi:phosphoserine aminotransferase
MSEIVIPHELRPADGRFGSGPSKVRQEAVEALARDAPAIMGRSHRKPGVRSLVRRVRDGLAAYFALPEGYEVVLGNGGATAFWDVLTHNLVRERSAHAVFGEFSGKFADAAARAPWLADPVRVAAEPGTHPAVADLVTAGVDAYALTHCETSTGVAMPVTRPVGSAEALTLVDATSAAGGIEFDPGACDVYYFSPQKCFAGDGGLWLALLSPAALARLDEVHASGRYVPGSLDLRLAVENSRLDQTYNTPAVATLYLLADQIDWLASNGGLREAARGCARKAAYLYGWAQERPWARPFVTEEARRSPVVCTIDLDASLPAEDVNAALRAAGIHDTDAYRKLGRNQLRVATFPAIDRADVEALTACVDHVAAHILA